MPGSGSATRAVPIGVSGDMATATPRRRHRPGGCGHARLGQPAAHQLGTRRTQGRQRWVIYRACGQLAGGHLTYHQKRGRREHQREKSERDRLGPDGALDGRHLHIPVRHQQPVLHLRAGELAGERFGVATEPVHRGSQPQSYCCPVGDQVAGAQATHECRAGHDHRDLVNRGDRLHRGARDDNANYPLSQRALVGGAGRPVAPEGSYHQSAADVQVEGSCPVLVDGDLAWAIWRRQSAGQQHGGVEYMLEPAVGRCHYLRLCPRVQDGKRFNSADAGHPGQRPIITAQPGAARRDQYVGRVGGLEETRICAVVRRAPATAAKTAPPAMATRSANTTQPRHRALSPCAARCTTAFTCSAAPQAPAGIPGHETTVGGRARDSPG